MSDKETGGPAFPHEYKFGDGTSNRHDGMTLRDYFAAKAFQVIMSQVLEAAAKEGITLPIEKWEYFATSCYGAADAMLKARNK